MRVLHVAATLSAEAGGPPATVRGTTMALAARGIRCDIATTTGGRFRQPSLPVPGLTVHAFEGSWLSSAWNAHSASLADFVGRRLPEFDLVHVHEPWHYPGFVATRGALSRRIPYLLSLHGALAPLALAQKAARKWLYMKTIQRPILQSAAALHALTNVEASHIERLGLPTPVVVIPNGVSVDIAQWVDRADTSTFLQRFPALSGKRVVLFLGRLARQKGLTLLARSFAHVAREFDDAALLVVGPNEGDTQAKAADELASAGLTDRVTFTGALDGQDKLCALACAQVFVLPSSSEGFSNAALEALAAGLPVVLSDHCNFPEVAEWGAGSVVRNDVAEIAAAICDLLQDDGRRQAAGRNGRRMVEERYSWPKIAGAFAALYESVVVSGQAAG
ncbi:MAG: glycosyltransferase [Rhodospirillaceae bacterium]|nr:glycosyltransferase [Rhodospirillaceae bacterium]